MIDIIIASIIASFVCHSIDILYSKGNLLHFIRYNFYLKKIDKINIMYSQLNNDLMNKSSYISTDEFKERLKELDEYKEVQYKKLWYFKPIISCVICFASTYGVLAILYLYLIDLIEINCIPLSVLITVLFNDIIYDIRKAIQK